MKLKEKIRFRLRQRGYRRSLLGNLTNSISRGIDELEEYLSEGNNNKEKRNKQ